MIPFKPSALPDCRREYSRSLHSGTSDVDRDENLFHSLGCVFLATGQLTYGTAIPEAVTAPNTIEASLKGGMSRGIQNPLPT